jgi:hypothetical protein
MILGASQNMIRNLQYWVFHRVLHKVWYETFSRPTGCSVMCDIKRYWVLHNIWFEMFSAGVLKCDKNGTGCFTKSNTKCILLLFLRGDHGPSPLYKREISFSNGGTAPSAPGPPHYRGFTITFRHTTLGRTPLDEWSARRRDLYLTAHNTHKRHAPAGIRTLSPS